MIKEYLSECLNPFDSAPAKLVNIATGQVATKEVEKSLMQGLEKGKTMMENFVQERLVETKRGFWEPIQTMPLKTLYSMKVILTNDKERKLQIDTEVLFRRLLVVSKY